MAEPILEVRELTVTGGVARILDRVSFTVAEGELLAVVGANGAGKSTLLRAVDGIIAPAGGMVLVAGRPVTDYPRRDLARLVSYVPQAAPPSPDFSVRTYLEMARYPHVGSWSSLRAADVAAVHAALDLTETAPLAERFLGSLSGGERQRVQIAAALAQGASVLLLDEPTTFLDYRHQTRIVELLQRLHRERGLTIIAATHDLNHTVAISDRVLALREGRVVLHDATAAIFDGGRLEEVYGTAFRLVATGGGHPLVVPRRSDPPPRPRPRPGLARDDPADAGAGGDRGR